MNRRALLGALVLGLSGCAALFGNTLHNPGELRKTDRWILNGIRVPMGGLTLAAVDITEEPGRHGKPTEARMSVVLNQTDQAMDCDQAAFVADGKSFPLSDVTSIRTAQKSKAIQAKVALADLSAATQGHEVKLDWCGTAIPFDAEARAHLVEFSQKVTD
jgi:hypothetical protein